jgi:hypothetical protein
MMLCAFSPSVGTLIAARIFRRRRDVHRQLVADLDGGLSADSAAESSVFRRPPSTSASPRAPRSAASCRSVRRQSVFLIPILFAASRFCGRRYGCDAEREV